MNPKPISCIICQITKFVVGFIVVIKEGYTASPNSAPPVVLVTNTLT
jgi:hypothetical protein